MKQWLIIITERKNFALLKYQLDTDLQLISNCNPELNLKILEIPATRGDQATEQSTKENSQISGSTVDQCPEKLIPVPGDQDHLKAHSLVTKPHPMADAPLPRVHQLPQSTSLANKLHQQPTGTVTQKTLPQSPETSSRYPSLFLQPEHLCLVLSFPPSLSMQCKAVSKHEDALLTGGHRTPLHKMPVSNPNPECTRKMLASQALSERDTAVPVQPTEPDLM